MPPPSILAEGDASAPVLPGGPGRRFELGPTGSMPHASVRPPSLPSAYGSGRLLALARDPHWIYTHWDFTDEQLTALNRKSALGHLVLRVFEKTAEGTPVLQQEVHPESRNWFLQVPRAGRSYLAELGYPDSKGVWQRVALSPPTLTPSDELSPETWVRFETVPFVVRPDEIVSLAQAAAAGNSRILETLCQAGAQAGVSLTPSLGEETPPRGRRSEVAVRGPEPASTAGTRWTPEQERALAELVSVDEARRVWIGSLEITELLRRQLIRGLSSGELPLGASTPDSGLGSAGAPWISGLSSPLGGGAPAGKGFRFEVNAELIVYGATEPDAAVTVCGRPIRLSPDGSFSFRFALPDGEFPLPVMATSADGSDQRSAQLSFRRASAYAGSVGTHRQDPSLKPPTAAAVG